MKRTRYTYPFSDTEIKGTLCRASQKRRNLFTILGTAFAGEIIRRWCGVKVTRSRIRRKGGARWKIRPPVAISSRRCSSVRPSENKIVWESRCSARVVAPHERNTFSARRPILRTPHDPVQPGLLDALVLEIFILRDARISASMSPSVFAQARLRRESRCFHSPYFYGR